MIPFGGLGGDGFDVVNEDTLNVSFSIPVFSRPGRGIDFNYAFNYNSWIWYPQPDYQTNKVKWEHVANWGWSTSNQIAGFYTYKQVSNACSAVPSALEYTDWSFHDALGTTHPLAMTLWSDSRCGATTASNLQTTDGSGYKVTSAQVSPSISLSLLSSNGTAIILTANSSTVTDSNGNRISYQNSTYTDTLGTTALTITPNGSDVSYDYPNPAGGMSHVIAHYATKTVQTNFSYNGCDSQTWEDFGPTGVSLISRISTPEGDYIFGYEPTPNNPNNTTGRINSVTLPTGAVYKYDSTNMFYNGDTPETGNTNCLDGSLSGMIRTTPDGIWTYTVRYPFEMDVQAPDGTTTVIDQTGFGNGANYEYSRYVYPAGFTRGVTNPISASRFFYNGCTTSFCAIIPPITQLAVTHQRDITLDGSGNIINSLWAETDTTYTTSGLPLSVMEYDYGNNARGPLLRQSAVDSYTTWDRPHQVTVKDGAGNILSQTTYTYDQGSLAASNATQLIGVPQQNTRGNPTTVLYTVQGSNNLYQTYTYFDSGQVQFAYDVNQARAEYHYDTCNHAYPTSVTMPLSLSRSIEWNCNGGVPTKFVDENTQSVQYGYSDPDYWRVSTITDQLRNLSTFSYAVNFFESQGPTFNNGRSIVDVMATLDTKRRPYVVQRRQSPGTNNFDTVEIDYDNLGRVARQTLPYFTTITGATNASAPGIATSYSFPAQTVQVTDANSGIASLQSVHNDILKTISPAPTGEAAKNRQSEYDGIGRLTSVCEITGSSNGGGACGQKNPQTGYLTRYTYTGTTVQVQQNAQGSSAQTRTFVYDTLGRLKSESNPETGTTTYTYDSDSANCGSSLGDLVRRVDNAGNVTCYAHDALHRVTAITYPAGPYASATPEKHYVYDTSVVISGSTMQNTSGRLAEAYTGPQTAKITDLGFSYNARGEVTDTFEGTSNSAGYYHLTASYYPHGVQQTLSGIPGLPTFTIGVDGEGRVNSVTTSTGTSPVTSATYDTSGTTIGALLNVNYGSTVNGNDYDAFTYSPNTMRPNTYTLHVGAQTVIGTLSWNQNGSLKQLAITDGVNSLDTQTCNYGYDDLFRITNASCGSWGQTFTYDAFGNLKKSGSLAFVPIYNLSTNRYQNLSGVTPTYDANGNLTFDGGFHFSWDSDGNAISIVPNLNTYANITYDALGRAVEDAFYPARPPRGGSGVWYNQVLYGPDGRKLAMMNGQSVVTAFIPLPGGGQAVYSGTTLAYYRHPDWLGSSRLATTPARTPYSDTAYAPYGEDYNGSGTRDVSFTGQNQDTAAGIYDFMFRRYHPTQGRWPSPDPAGLSAVNPGNPQTWNRYAYVAGQPLAAIDPTGLDGCFSGDPVTCVLTYGAPGSGSGSLGFNGGPLGGGPGGSGGGPGPTLLSYNCSRCIAHAIIRHPGGAPKFLIRGPSYSVMSDRSTPGIEGLFRAPGMPQLWHAASGTADDLFYATGAVIAAPAVVDAGAGLANAAMQRAAFGPALGRVFYSGYGAYTRALIAAGTFGGNIIDTTPLGRLVDFGENTLITFGMEGEQASALTRGIWNLMSGPYANGASDTVMTYQSWALGTTATWGLTEYPVLTGNGTNIIWMAAGW